MQIQPLWAYDLIDHVQFWQTEQGFDTIDIHEQGSFFWVTCFLECCEESCACQQPLSVPCYQAQTLASNLAKSLIFWASKRVTMPSCSNTWRRPSERDASRITIGRTPRRVCATGSALSVMCRSMNRMPICGSTSWSV